MPPVQACAWPQVPHTMPDPDSDREPSPYTQPASESQGVPTRGLGEGQSAVAFWHDQTPQIAQPWLLLPSHSQAPSGYWQPSAGQPPLPPSKAVASAQVAGQAPASSALPGTPPSVFPRCPLPVSHCSTLLPASHQLGPYSHNAPEAAAAQDASIAGGEAGHG